MGSSRLEARRPFKICLPLKATIADGTTVGKWYPTVQWFKRTLSTGRAGGTFDSRGKQRGYSRILQRSEAQRGTFLGSRSRRPHFSRASGNPDEIFLFKCRSFRGAFSDRQLYVDYKECVFRIQGALPRQHQQRVTRHFELCDQAIILKQNEKWLFILLRLPSEPVYGFRHF
jgi:hypothetical protein